MFFRGDYYFLSNFYPCKVVDNNGTVWPSVEHAYQAMKFKDYLIRDQILKHPSKGLKAFCRKLGSPPPNWDEAKATVMWLILQKKFWPGSDLANRLLTTGQIELVEDNTWHDGFWGNCTCGRCPKGRNELGKALMDIRERLNRREEVRL